MKRVVPASCAVTAVGLAFVLIASNVPAHCQPPQALPNMGQQITPLAPHGSRFEPLNPELPYDPAFPAGGGWLASHAVSTVVSPDRKTLLILTNGYNRVSDTHLVPQPPTLTWIASDSTEYVCIYDISTPRPVKRQVLQVPYAYNGIVFDPSGSGFNVSGGPSTSAALAPDTDLFFRGFDNSLPDYYRFKEFEREFVTNYARGGLPCLSLIRFMHDHTGNYDTAIDGVNTPETEEADNDYARGLLIQKIASLRPSMVRRKQ